MSETPNTVISFWQHFSNAGSIFEGALMSAIATFSAAIHYLDKVRKGLTFSFFAFLVNSLVAVLMAFLFDTVLLYLTSDQCNMKLRMIFMVLVGISGNKLLEMVESKSLGAIGAVLDVILHKFGYKRTNNQ